MVIDEAHRLRNVYKPSNIIANTLKQALKDAPKLLLTATPLQNALLELYGLVSFVDERTFGDLKSFREQFANLHNARVFETLKARLQPVCKRTLRRQVLRTSATPDVFPSCSHSLLMNVKIVSITWYRNISSVTISRRCPRASARS